MKEEVNKILESGLIEEYYAGILSGSEKKLVEEGIKNYPEVAKEYRDLQLSIESFARSLAIKPPSGMKRRIFSNMDAAGFQVRSLFNPYLGVAASLLAVVFLSTSLIFYSQKQEISTDLMTLENDYSELSRDYKETSNELSLIGESLGFLKDPNTGKFVLVGNQLAPELQTVAYWNPVDEKSFIEIKSLPVLPEDQCLQMWADVDGEMISLGVLPELIEDLIPLPFKVKAASLNITIEPLGGSEHPHVDKLVASKSI